MPHTPDAPGAQVQQRFYPADWSSGDQQQLAWFARHFNTVELHLSMRSTDHVRIPGIN